tara:strand:+ start:159 stop:1613 length:1455 start_codon:yes stop_codon:yes gene_type:complete
VTNIRSILLLLLLLSFDLSAGYIKSPDETPLNISICTLPEINGSLDETGLLGLIPKMMFKSGTLSTCAIHESLGNIRGDTLSGPSLASSSEADERNIQHCKEIMCRSQNAKLLFDRSEEVINLRKKSGKTSRLKKIRSVSKKYNEFYKKYGESGASFTDAEEYVSEQLEVLIIKQFNALPKSTQQKWISNFESEVAKKRELERIALVALAKKRELERIALAKKRELERIALAKKRELEAIALAKKRELEGIALAKKRELERIDLAKKRELERIDLAKKGGIAFLCLCVLIFSWKKLKRFMTKRSIKQLEDTNRKLKSEALEFFSDQSGQDGLNIAGTDKGNILDYVSFRNQIDASISQNGESLLCAMLYCFSGDQVLSSKEKILLELHFSREINDVFDLALDLGLRSGKGNGYSKVMDEIFFVFASFDFESTIQQDDEMSALKDIFGRLNPSTRSRTITLIKSLTPENQRTESESTFIRLLSES